jgi:sugar lactone lactonase YvrE
LEVDLLKRIQALNFPQRVLIFILIFGGGLALLVAVSLLLAIQAVNSSPRTTSTSLVEGVMVREFATLPDEDAYPASVATSADGMVYTGSYVSGVIWAIDSAGSVTEIPSTRSTLGSVAGIIVAPDGILYVVDRLKPGVGSRGGALMRVSPEGIVSEFGFIDDAQGFQIPDDIALDARGFVYVTDWGRDEVWRFPPEGGAGILWWTSPQVEGLADYAPTGIAYDSMSDALLITDPTRDILYRVPTALTTPAETVPATEILYEHGDRTDLTPGFDGLTVTPNGEIYLAALGVNKVAQLVDGELVYLAGDFRGASDVSYGQLPDGRSVLYVSNWDQFSLLLEALEPRLPFGIDVIELP